MEKDCRNKTMRADSMSMCTYLICASCSIHKTLCSSPLFLCQLVFASSGRYYHCYRTFDIVERGKNNQFERMYSNFVYVQCVLSSSFFLISSVLWPFDFFSYTSPFYLFFTPPFVEMHMQQIEVKHYTKHTRAYWNVV